MERHDAAGDGGGEQGPAAPTAGRGPAAVAALARGKPREHAFFVFAPGQALFGRAFREHLRPAVLAEEVYRRSIVELGVFVVAAREAVADRHTSLAVFEPLLAIFVLLLARADH